MVGLSLTLRDKCSTTYLGKYHDGTDRHHALPLRSLVMGKDSLLGPLGHGNRGGVLC
jgi:hypothetical protein